MNLPEQFVSFLNSQKAQSSASTIKNYKADITSFIRWFETEFKKAFEPNLVTPQIIEIYKKEAGVSPRSLKRHISSLRKFFHFLKIQGLASANPLEQAAASSGAQAVQDPYRLRDFKNYLYVYNLSNLTIKNYVIDIRQFLDWARQVLKIEVQSLSMLGSINLSLVEEYKKRLLESHFSPLTVNRKLSSLRKFFSWAKEEGILKTDIAFTSQPLYQTPVFDLSALKAEFTPIKSEFAVINNELQALGQKETELANREESLEQELAAHEEESEYSNIPPIRLFQKSAKVFDLALDALVIYPLVKLVKGLEYLAWKAKGAPVFLPAGRQVVGGAPNAAPAALKNIPKQFYSPLSVSTKGLSLPKKIYFLIRFSMPEWYKRYHSYRSIRWIHYGVILFLASFLAFGLYRNLIGTGVPGMPGIPGISEKLTPRTLSFQGKLLSNKGEPITTAQKVRFAIYNDPKKSGNALLWEETRTVTPDEKGNFKITLGDASRGGTLLHNELFVKNVTVWLGIKVGQGAELLPRQQLPNVALGDNSNFLRGLTPITAPDAGTTNVVLALDSSGNLTMGGSATPTFQATGGQFTVSGNVLLLTTAAGSDSDIIISPDGLGKVDIRRPIHNASETGTIPGAIGAVQFDDSVAIFASGSGETAFLIDQNGTGDIISASSSGTAKFTVDSLGNTTIARNLTIQGLSLSAATADFTIGSINMTGNFAQTGSGSFSTGTGSATLNGNTTLGSTTSNAITFTGRVAKDSDLLPIGTDGTNDLGSAELPWDNIYVNHAVPKADGQFGWWKRENKTISPVTSTDAVSLGGTLTVTGATTLKSTLAVTGATTLSSTLDVTGATGLSSTLNVSGATTLSSTLGVTGATTLSSTLAVTGNTTLTGDLAVNGGDITTTATTFNLVNATATTLNIGGAATTVSLGAATGTTTVNNALTATGLITANGGLTVPSGQATTLASFTSNGGILYTNASGVVAQVTAGTSTQVLHGGTTPSFSAVSLTADVSGVLPIANGGTNKALTLAAGAVAYTDADSFELTAVGTSGQCLTSAGSGTPAWADCALGDGTNWWSVTNGALHPINSSLDLLVGSTASSSAKFAVLNVDSGTPTASVSAGTAGGAYLTATGNLATTAMQNMTIGGSTTGNITLDSGTGVVNLADATASRIVFTDASKNLTYSALSSVVLNTITDETGTGVLVFNIAPNLASPIITSTPTAAGATWTDLGSVTTADINGGTIDGTVIGGSVRAAGSFTTVSTSGDITTTATTFNLVNATATTVSFAGAATTLNIGPTGASGSIVFSGGSADTGCTLDGTTGNLTCSGDITGGSSGTIGYWTRTSTTLSPATSNDIVSISSNNTTAAILAVTGTAATTGNVFDISSTSTAATSSDLIQGDHTATYTSATTVSGNLLDLSRALTINAAATTLTVSGAVAAISDNCTQTAGTCTSTADVLAITQSYTSNSGAALNVTTAGTGFALRVNDDGTLTDSTPFVVDNTGNVGIGTTTIDSGTKVEVDGNIRLSTTAGSGGIYNPTVTWLAGNAYRNTANTQWLADTGAGAGTASILRVGNDLPLRVTYNTGLTADTAFTASVLMDLSTGGQLQLPTTGSSAGLLLGGDANLYRAEANVLQTDDTFRAKAFYDGDNTTYFLDPAATGTALNVAGNIILANDRFLKGTNTAAATINLIGYDSSNLITIGDSSVSQNFQLVDSGNSGTTPIMYWASSGNVGIADNSPASLFTVGSGDLFRVDSTGYVGVLTAPHTDGQLRVGGVSTNAVSSYGIQSFPTQNGAATNIVGFSSQPNTSAAAFTVTNAVGLWAFNPGKGAGSTITNAYGIRVDAQTVGGTNNFGLYIENPSGGATTNRSLQLQNNGAIGFYTAAGGTGWTTITADTNDDLIFRSAGGALSLVVDSGGSVGMGTTTPDWDLEVEGVQTDLGITSTGGDTNTVSLRLTGGATNAAWAIGTNNSGVATGADTLWFYNTATNNKALVVQSDGDVGIGTTNPVWDLSLSKATAGQTSLQIANTGTGGRDYLLLSTNDANAVALGGKFSIYDNTAGQYRITLNSSGNVGIGTTAPADNNVLTLSRAGNNTVYFESSVADDWAIGTGKGVANGTFVIWHDTGTAAALTINTSRNVGIGTTDTNLFNAVGGVTKLAVTGSSASTAVTGNTDASISIINTDDTADNTAGLHFAWQDTDGTPNYAGASIVSVLGTKVAGQYPDGELVFLTSTSTNSAPSEKMRIDNNNVTIQNHLTMGGGVYLANANTAANALNFRGGAGSYDVNLYWGAANQLKTDDTFVATALQGTCNLAFINDDDGQANNLSQSDVNCADYAEQYDASEPVEPGDILAVDPQNNVKVKKAVLGQSTLMGIVSTNPGVVITGDKVVSGSIGPDLNTPTKPAVALAGRVPVKVSLENGPILISDAITSSSVPGVGMKATKPGPIVGRALEGFDGSLGTTGKIMVFVNTSWHDPDVYLTSTGDFNISPTLDELTGLPTNKYQVKNPLGEIISRIGVFAEIAVGNLRAGIITTNKLVSPIVETEMVRTNIISPLAQDSSIALKFEASQLSIVNGQSSVSASFDSNGNATLSGTLHSENIETKQFTSDNLQVTNDATISGTLRAKKILAEQIDGLEGRIKQLTSNNLQVTNQATISSQLSNVTGQMYELSATESALLAYAPTLTATFGKFDEGVVAGGGSSIADLSVIGQLSVDGGLALAGNSINVLDADLELQPLRQGGISILSGLIHIDIAGNVKFGGNAEFEKDVKVKGTLYASLISPVPDEDLVIKLPDNSQFAIRNSQNEDVFAINSKGDLIASGSATFSKLNLSLAGEALALSEVEGLATGSAGIATISAQQSQLTIQNSLVTDKSLIYLTPVGSSKQIFLLKQQPSDPALSGAERPVSQQGGSFTVGIQSPAVTDTPFNWLIVN